MKIEGENLDGIEQKVSSIINGYIEDGKKFLAYNGTDFYPCMKEDIPNGALDDYFDISSPDAAEAVRKVLERDNL